MYRVMYAIGLGGTRAKYTNGDYVWCAVLAWGSGFLMGLAVTMAMWRYWG